jgi:hypothetical protein
MPEPAMRSAPERRAFFRLEPSHVKTHFAARALLRHLVSLPSGFDRNGDQRRIKYIDSHE